MASKDLPSSSCEDIIEGAHAEDVKELQGNFEQQQAMINQLRDMIKQKELSQKQHEIEDYAVRLAKMKPKLIRSRGRLKSGEKRTTAPVRTVDIPIEKAELPSEKKDQIEGFVDVQKEEISVEAMDASKEENLLQAKVSTSEPMEATQTSVASQESGSRSKILLLRKQLEENRLKFERQKRENDEKKATMDDMKERIEKLRMEVEHRDTVIQSLHEIDSAQVTQQNVQHLYQQIIYKDNTLLELTDKINHLEGILQDHKEQLDEKDQLISAKTEAVSLVTKDRDEKMMKMLQELEDVKLEMQRMQQTFAENEETWHKKEKSLSLSIEEKNRKISVLEENSRRIESIRFELSSRNAELQEKLVVLQGESKDLHVELNTAKDVIKDQSNTIKEMKQKLVRAEAFGQKKLKALEKQVSNLCNNSDFSEQILELQNRIAELEEEKGNLQLKLVDFDDQKLQLEKFQSTTVSLEEQLEKANKDLLLQINLVSRINQEKGKLTDELNSKYLTINSLENNVLEMEEEFKEIKQAKVTLELRLCALEEERDVAIKNKKDIENEFKKLGHIPPDEYEAETVKLRTFIEELQDQIKIKDNRWQECQYLTKEAENKAIEAIEAKLNKISENQCLVAMLAEKEISFLAHADELNNLKSYNEQMKSELYSNEKIITEKKQIIIKLEDQISSLHQETDSLRNTVERLEKNISEYNNQISQNHVMINQSKEVERSLNSTLSEREKVISNLYKEIDNLSNELTKKESIICNHLQKLNYLENELKSIEFKYSSTSSELSQRDELCKKLKHDVENLNKCMKETESKLNAECETISCLLVDRDNQIKMLEQQLTVKAQEINNNQIVISKFENELCEKNRLFDNLDAEYEHSKSNLSSMTVQISELSSNLEDKLVEIRNLQEDINQKDIINARLENEKIVYANANQKLEEEKEDLINCLKMKENELLQIQSEHQSNIEGRDSYTTQIQQMISEKDAEIAHLSETLNFYTSEISKKLNIIENCEMEIKEKEQKIITLEQDINAKLEIINKVTSEKEESNQFLAESQSKLSASEHLVHNLQSDNEKLNDKIYEISEAITQTQQNLEYVESLKTQLESRVIELENDIENKSKIIENLQQNSYDSSSELSSNVLLLQSQLQDSLNQLENVKEFYESQIQEKEEKYTSILEDNTKLSSQLSEKQQELDILKGEQVAFVGEEEINQLNEKISALMATQHKNEQEIILYKEKLAKISHFEAHEDSTKDLQKENSLLKKQIAEQNQAITQLETILATQSNQANVSQGSSSDEWGNVDLGEPGLSNISMQTSLIEKDKTLTLIQEQLKGALEQISSSADENKLLQHKLTVLESELFHRDKNIETLRQQKENLEAQLSTLKDEFQSKNLLLGQEKALASSSQDNFEEVDNNFAAFFESDDASQSITNPSWFKPSSSSVSTGFDDKSSSQIEEVSIKEETLVKKENNEDLQFKLAWYEENWPQWTDYCNQLKLSYEESQSEIDSLKQQLEIYKNEHSSPTHEEYLALQQQYTDLEKSYNQILEEKDLIYDNLNQSKLQQEKYNDVVKKLDEANLEVRRLTNFEMQVFELQSQIQTLQHHCSALETQVSVSENDAKKLHEYEVLYGELQSCMQESETKREGSKSRVQELELMVQSAESEIAKLRTELQSLNSAHKILEDERLSGQEDIQVILREKKHLEEENDKLRSEVANLQSQISNFQELDQRSQREINQLKSELEVIEGENERMRSNWEIMENENNRLQNESDFLMQTNQMLTAQKESLETEIQRLESTTQGVTSERDHFRGEMQRLYEVSTSAESEISRLKQEINNLNSLKSSYDELQLRYYELQNSQQPSQQEKLLEEVDWGTEAKIEDEHLHRFSSVEPSLRAEIDQFKQNIIELEKEKNQLNDDLQTLKLKNGKIVQKLKAANNKNENLLKEIEKLKGGSGGFSGLDQAVEQEYLSQVAKAEGERDELKIKLDEVEKEKDRLNTKMEVLENSQEKYFQMKELQDASMRQLSVSNKNLESQVAALEWKLSEMEENIEQQNKREILPTEAEGLSEASSEIHQLKTQIGNLETEISKVKNENFELVNIKEELESKLELLSVDNDGLQSILNNLRDAKNKSELDVASYKSSFVELHNQHEDLQESSKKTQEELEQLQHQQATLKAAYDVLYDDYQQLQDERDSYKYDFGIVTGERDKFEAEIQSLNNQLEALKEEEDDETINGLQDECADLREQNNVLKDELTRLGESTKQAEETTDRTKLSLDQQIEIQDMLRSDLVLKSGENEQLKVKIEEKDREIKYLSAEIAALKTAQTQHRHNTSEAENKIEQLKRQHDKALEEIQQLKKQVEVVDSSLLRLATRGNDSLTESDLSSESKPLSVTAATELEAALMSLHLRDLRCQQLSLEIHKLLEERDSLQLKLSASLRQNQELNRELTHTQQLSSPISPHPSLTQKLAELRDINSSLEKKAIEGRGSLPPTFPTFISHTAPSTPSAARYADYTVTRDNQGSPSTLMSWFMGKSSPKEVLHV